MAEVQQDNGGGKGKNHQKKMTIRVDFTPMVDMNMLLITFFMLCTTMIKSQTLNIALPSNEKVDNVENMSQASADDAVTIILDAKRKVGSMAVDTVNGKVVNEVYYSSESLLTVRILPILPRSSSTITSKSRNSWLMR